MSRALQSETTVVAACGVSCVLGMFFIFAWAPHPWGWEGFDHYHQLALAVAAGRPFPTLEVPWGYAYFAAFWYRVFGDRPWIVLIVQAALNGSIPWIVYRFARTWTDRRTAIGGALVAGIFSFNTIYASTQSSDAVCTVLVALAVMMFAEARLHAGVWRYAAAGTLAGVAAQFRPNIVLLPALLATYAVATSRTWTSVARAAIVVACALGALLPWIVRNYRLTGLVLPTSVHGGVQLWYGSLQVGPYLRNYAYNPKAVFEAAAFRYTSLPGGSIEIEARRDPCTDAELIDAALVYWTDDDARRVRVAPFERTGDDVMFRIVRPQHASALYYYFDATWRREGNVAISETPLDGAAVPAVYFLSRDHLGDLDRRGDLLDIFDVIRLARHRAWNEPVDFAPRLAAAHIGPDAVESATEMLIRAAGYARTAHAVTVHAGDADVQILLGSGGRIVIPRQWSKRITDLTVEGGLAVTIMRAHVALGALAKGTAFLEPAHDIRCMQLIELGIDRAFYRSEPHLMQRYLALALDNIRRQPSGFAAACAYRAVRLFVIGGDEDAMTTQQFVRGRLIYGLATVATLLYLVLFVFGAGVAWRRGSSVGLPLLLIAYVPLTIAPVLTNMRYSITVQPIVCVFIAAALIEIAAVVDRSDREANRRGAMSAGRGR